MIKKYIFGALFLMCLISSISVVSAGVETQLTQDQRLALGTSIYENMVTWTESSTNSVHVYNLTAGNEIEISGIFGSTSDIIHVYGNKVIWSDHGDDIFMYNISSGNTTEISSDGNSPDIYRNNVIFTKTIYDDNHNSYDNVFLYNTSSKNITQLTVGDDAKYYTIAIYENKIVWNKVNTANLSSDVYLYDITTRQETKISESGSASNPDIYGNVVVWQESRNGTNIYVRDLSENETIQVTTSGIAFNPAIYGNRIVWQNSYISGEKYLTGAYKWLSDIYMYEISTAKTTRITTSTCAEFPSIYDDKIIYADSRNDPDYGDETDIYLYDLSAEATTKPIAVFTSNVTSGVAPLSVQFTDESENAVSWDWDFENDGNVDSADKNPVNVYANPGNYTVILTVGNENGTSSVTQKISVQGQKDLPVAVPGANVTSGYIPLCVQFTDFSQNITSRSWDIGNDGTVDSTDANFTYEFSSRGIYPVKLTVNNGNSSSSEIITISVLEKSGNNGSSSSDGSGSGSGSAGGSPEPAKNVKIKELCQAFITSGKNVNFDFTKNATAIVNLSFDSKKTVGKTTTIIEVLKNKSTLTPDAPEGGVYNYLNIWVGNGGYGSDEDNLENAVINFRVEKSWIKDKDIDQSSIVLNRYSDKKWNELPTTFLNEDDKYLYFKAESPGFSPFAITGEATKETEIQPEVDINKSNGCTAENVEQTENKENTTTSDKKRMTTPGFELFYGIGGLFVISLYRRR